MIALIIFSIFTIYLSFLVKQLSQTILITIECLHVILKVKKQVLWRVIV